MLYQELEHKEEGTWVVIDEVQKVPILLDEVHRLMEERHLKFLLSGSSARKLKKGASNLLAGRAVSTEMFPLVSAEVGFKFDLSKVLSFGTLPMAFIGDDPKSYLRTYAEVYLQEEIKAEALTRNIGGFSRFLEIAARQNGQITSILAISRDAQVARQTVQGYFDILHDTLIGYWLQPWKLRRSTKQVTHPKFYFFDAGVVRALSGRLPYPPTQEELGFLFETLVLNEIRAYLSYTKLNYPIYFWASHGGLEVDVTCEDKDGFVAIELKSASVWDSKFNKGLRKMSEEIVNARCFGVYTGEREVRPENIRVMPIMSFLTALWNGEVIK